MRILHTASSLDPVQGGVAICVPQIAAATAGEGCEVHLWSPDIPAGLELDPGIAVHRGDLESVLASIGKPDSVHDHGIWLPLNHRVAGLARRHAIPRVVSPHGMLEPWSLNHRKWKKRLAWRLYQKRDLDAAVGLHATAESEAEQFRKLGLRPPIVVAPNGVRVPRDRGATVRNPGSPRTALFLSRVHPKKGLPMWVEVWQRVRPEGWRMRVVGPDEGGHRAEIRRLVEQAGLADCWSFEDSLGSEAKWQAMAEADLFVLPTHSENFGIVVAEALAARTPVLTTTGAPWKGLEEHGCGWWVEPTADALEAGFRRALAASGSFDEMGRRGRAWVERDFAWDSIARKLTRFYASIEDR